MVVEILVPAERTGAARSGPQRVGDAYPWLRGSCKALAGLALDLAHQHQTVIRAERSAFEIGIDHPMSETPKTQFTCSTLYRRSPRKIVFTR